MRCVGNWISHHLCPDDDSVLVCSSRILGASGSRGGLLSPIVDRFSSAQLKINTLSI